MLGFTAHAATTEIHLRDQELEDARWFTRAEIASGSPKVPPSISISFRLIENWFDAGGGPRLREIQGAAHWPSTR
jgi:NAD+ diphosphatase